MLSTSQSALFFGCQLFVFVECHQHGSNYSGQSGFSARDCSQGYEASSTAAATDSRLLFLAKFLESGIGAQWVPEWIES
jgi:hypothetical protein